MRLTQGELGELTRKKAFAEEPIALTGALSNTFLPTYSATRFDLSIKISNFNIIFLLSLYFFVFWALKKKGVPRALSTPFFLNPYSLALYNAKKHLSNI